MSTHLWGRMPMLTFMGMVMPVMPVDIIPEVPVNPDEIVLTGMRTGRPMVPDMTGIAWGARSREGIMS
jgi:hypothetical protein